MLDDVGVSKSRVYEMSQKNKQFLRIYIHWSKIILSIIFLNRKAEMEKIEQEEKLKEKKKIIHEWISETEAGINNSQRIFAKIK